MLIEMFYGFCMALADSVPGVSGGTIAFILGFYERLLDSIHYLFSNDKGKRKESAHFIINLIIGWIVAMTISVFVLAGLFESHIYILSSLFLGLSLSAIPIIIITEKKELKGKYSQIIFTIIGIVLVIGISSLRNTVLNNTSISFDKIGVFQCIYIFISGMISISAMVLPGISGSTLLLIFGLYVPTISAIKSFLTFDFSVIWGLIALGFGILFGLFISIRFIRMALKNHKSKMIYFILGLMVGSLYSIIMGATTLKTPLSPLSIYTFNVAAFLIGIFILFALEAIRKKLEKKHMD